MVVTAPVLPTLKTRTAPLSTLLSLTNFSTSGVMSAMSPKPSSSTSISLIIILPPYEVKLRTFIVYNSRLHVVPVEGLDEAVRTNFPRNLDYCGKKLRWWAEGVDERGPFIYFEVGLCHVVNVKSATLRSSPLNNIRCENLKAPPRQKLGYRSKSPYSHLHDLTSVVFCYVVGNLQHEQFLYLRGAIKFCADGDNQGLHAQGL
ncbi:predicted coding region AF_0740 [Archaeoglobus fulgidus DSM 4304]|uniref:Putative uncharacterized protein AF_0740 n=1 Tax=Archaeoglobus fulgidus (strain ATCC 49558 / DSM 4304 / JCM 9628 / NBRC 100126 / VC-16) TaxID=224325 RepID=Y740_ARCFU|nr:PUTATIVE PSEUDOGENE: RecName: Full=Putative uncharacterized protein AF_0740 [Archaeoglobus fulgidus DSM 4304]AAB90513.1 predicted coding region AF_0740 [Archaeoglobus fulgidus DSM 4304]